MDVEDSEIKQRNSNEEKNKIDENNKIKPNMNCILTPHISGVTIESNVRVSDFIVKKIIYFF